MPACMMRNGEHPIVTDLDSPRPEQNMEGRKEDLLQPPPLRDAVNASRTVCWCGSVHGSRNQWALVPGCQAAESTPPPLMTPSAGHGAEEEHLRRGHAVLFENFWGGACDAVAVVS